MREFILLVALTVCATSMISVARDGAEMSRHVNAMKVSRTPAF